MKKKIGLFLLIFPFLLSAQQNFAEGPEELLFSETIKTLNAASESRIEELMEEEAWFALEGSLSSMTRLSEKGRDYLLEALLVQGEWKGLEAVVKYECILVFQGNVWEGIVPERTPRKVEEGMILLNSHVLVLGRIIGYEKRDGRIVPRLLVGQIRDIS